MDYFLSIFPHSSCFPQVVSTLYLLFRSFDTRGAQTGMVARAREFRITTEEKITVHSGSFLDKIWMEMTRNM
jgi:hypothetical protein